MPGVVHREVDAAATKGVHNSQPEGIGRVVTLGDLVCWNNLGRNVIFADHQFRPRAVFGTTLFPGDDEPSQYDLDIHSILELPELGMVVVLNHFGTVRGFRRAEILGNAADLENTGGGLIEPAATWSFVADIERSVSVAGRLVGSAPRSDGALGLLVSEPLDTGPDHGTIATRHIAREFGEVTALGVMPSPEAPLLSVGGEARVALLSLAGNLSWEKDLAFRVASLVWHGNAIWAAGPDLAGPVDDYDWEQWRGGGFAVLDQLDGTVLMAGRLPDEVAWGTGGVAVAPFGSKLAAAGRTGRLHLVDPRDGTAHSSTGALSATSLGIAHMAVAGHRLLCGFNRGGYRLHAFTDPEAERIKGRAPKGRRA